jgi:nucleotide-binding universal stress UspA family protein
MINKILAAVDGSKHSVKVVDYASDIALKYDGELFLMYVITKAAIPEDFLKYAETEKIDETPESLLFSRIADEILLNAEKQAIGIGVKVIHKVVKQGDPADEIAKFAKREKVDWIFLGSRGLGAIKGLLMGSVSRKVCNTAEATCITVK